MSNLYNIMNQIKSIILSSSENDLQDVNHISMFMLPPTDNPPSVCIVPVNEYYTSYTSKYYNTRYDLTIDSYAFSYNRLEAQEKTIEIIKDIKNELESDYSLQDYVDVVKLVGDITSGDRQIGDRYLAWSSIDIAIEDKKMYDLDYRFSNTIYSGKEFEETKEYIVSYLRQELSNYFNEFNVMPIDNLHADPALIFNFKSSDYTYRDNSLNHSESILEFSIISRFLFKEESAKNNIELLEEVKKSIRKNYQMGGYCESINLDYTDFNVDRLNNNFYSVLDLNTNLVLRND